MSATDPYAAERQRKLENLGYDCSEGMEAVRARFHKKYSGQQTDELKALTEEGGYLFSEVLDYELRGLAGPVPDIRHASDPLAAYAPATPADVNGRAHAAQLAGLAFSGGGVRSATFNLGVVQALAEMKMLRHFDYLSTVSGGGYTGGWLSKWISQHGGDVTRVEAELAGAPGEPLPRRAPWPVQFLRRYSNYLTPRKGLFSADTWTLLGTYLRNTLLNMTMLFALLALVFLLPRIGLHWLGGTPLDTPRAAWAWAAGLPFLWVVFSIALSISRKGKLPTRGLGSQTQGAVLVCVCLPLIVAAFAGAIAVWEYRVELAAYWRRVLASAPLDAVQLAWPGIAYFAAWAAGWSTAQVLNARDRHASWRGLRNALTAWARRGSGTWWNTLRGALVGTAIKGVSHFVSAVVGLAVGSVVLVQGAKVLVDAHANIVSPVQLLAFGAPVMLALFGLSVTLMIGLVGRLYHDQSREWWARQGAWTVIGTVAWLALFASAFYLPPLLHWAWENAKASITLAGVVSTIATAIGLKSGSDKDTGVPGFGGWKRWVPLLAPYAFMLLTIAALTTALQALVAPPVAVPAVALKQMHAYVGAYQHSSELAATGHGAGPVSLAALLVVLFAVAAVLSWRVDVNKFSLYMMYRMRLVRAYFGASNPDRAPHPFTGFDPADDPKLADMLGAATPGAPEPPVEFQRPYHLINAAVNMVGGKELAWQTRKAGNFCFAPAFCGFELPQMPRDGRRHSSPRGAYRPTSLYASKDALWWERLATGADPASADADTGVKLGMAVAVSGAAASPSMGYHSSPPLSFLMTLFNVRLGRWSPNPVRSAWKRASPPVGIASIMSELFGLTDTRSNFLYLSDGGHFENLGVYELVRRRCRLVVAVDASCDAGHQFGDLGNAIRKCQTDFNVPIELDAGQIRSLDPTTEQGLNFVTGTIRYSQADGPVADGVLLYIKPAMIGGENADILNYSKMHPEFPHQSTADQWFDEDQFESYRMLGHSAARAALAGVADALERCFGAAAVPAERRKECVQRICELLAPAPGSTFEYDEPRAA